MPDITPNFGLALPVFDQTQWHDDVNANFSAIDTALAAAVATINSGPWDNSTVYAQGDRVFDTVSFSVYQCDVAHTSPATGSFATYRAANPTHWIKLAPLLTVRGAWTTGTVYGVNEIVFSAADLLCGIVTTAHTSGASMRADVANFSLLFDLEGQALPVAGGTMTGDIDMDGNDITNVLNINGNDFDDVIVTIATIISDIGDLEAADTALDGRIDDLETVFTALNASGLIEVPANQDYIVRLNVAFAGTIVATTTKCASGTATATFKINATPLGGAANSVSSAEQTQAHASANAFVAGDDIVLTISAVASCDRLSFTIKYTRTL